MKDKNGIYYYPYLDNKKVKMYIRQIEDTIEFRLWNDDDPMLWMEHGWVSYDAIQQASAIYDGKQFDPKKTYDIHIARSLLKKENMAS